MISVKYLKLNFKNVSYQISFLLSPLINCTESKSYSHYFNKNWTKLCSTIIFLSTKTLVKRQVTERLKSKHKKYRSLFYYHIARKYTKSTSTSQLPLFLSNNSFFWYFKRFIYSLFCLLFISCLHNKIVYNE